jgi:hypothetical protein
VAVTTTTASGAGAETNDRRRHLLQVHEAVASTYAALIGAAPGDDDRADEVAHVAEDAFWTGERLREAYLDLLPSVTVSRCPHSGAPVRLPLDTFDLDGLWWAYQTPLRRLGERPASLVALTGALRLATEVPWTSFLVKPGPAVPYVLPRLLEDPSIVAVVSEVPIGAHTGFVVAYFSPAADDLVVRANDWGANGFVRTRADGALEWGAVPEDETEMDVDLRPWLDAGRLRWVAPGDTGASLRDGADGCPFVDLPGRRDLQRIEEGQVR